MSKQEPEKATIRAVLALAQTLRQRGELQVGRDPWAKPYMPSEAVARKLCSQHGPEDAIEILNYRAKAKDTEYRDQQELSRRSIERHKRRQKDAKADREKQRRGLTVGQRIDKALAEFSLVPAASAAQVGWSTPSTDRSGLSNHGDPAGEAKYVALRAAREVEALLDAHKTRDIEKAA